MRNFRFSKIPTRRRWARMCSNWKQSKRPRTTHAWPSADWATLKSQPALLSKVNGIFFVIFHIFQKSYPHPFFHHYPMYQHTLCFQEKDGNRVSTGINSLNRAIFNLIIFNNLWESHHIRFFCLFSPLFTQMWTKLLLGCCRVQKNWTGPSLISNSYRNRCTSS